MGILKSSAKASMWQAISLVVNFVTNTVVVGILARLLLPEQFGTIAIANTVINLTSMIADVGVGQFIIKEPVIDRRVIRSIMSVTLIVGVTYVVMICAAAPFVAGFYKMNELTLIIIIIAFSILVKKIGLISQNLLYKEMKFKEVAIIDVVSYLIGYGAVGIILALLGFGVYSLVWALLLKSVVHTLLTYILAPHTLVPGGDKQTIVEIFSFGGGILTMSLSGSVAYQAPSLIIGKLLNSTMVGFFDRALSYAIYPVTATGSIFDMVFYAAAAKLQGTENSGKIVSYSYARLITVLSLPIFVLTAILVSGAEDFILILLGSQWVDVVPVFQIICMGIYFRIIVGFCDAVYKLKDVLYKATVIRLIYAFLVIAFTIAVSLLTHNLLIVCVAVNIAVLVNFILSSILVNRVMPIDMRYVSTNTLVYLLCASISGTIWYILRGLLKTLYYNCVVFALTDFLAIIFISLIVLFVVFNRYYKELLSFVKPLLRQFLNNRN